MSNPWSKRLGAADNATTEHDFAVPAGKVWSVQCIVATAWSNSPTDRLLVAIGGVATFENVTTPGQNKTATWTGMAVLYAGETLVVAPVGTWSFVISGYELDSSHSP